MSTTTTAFVFLAKFAEFYYHKIFEDLKHEVDDDLSVYVDERSPCGLAITGDQDKSLYKDLSSVTCNYAASSTGNGITTPTEKLPYRGLYRVAFTAQIW